MNCNTLAEYLDAYGPLMADRARQAFEPLHVPSTDPVVQLDLRRPMLPAQGHVVTAAVKTLQKQKALFLTAACGTGKTQMALCTVHAHANGKPYRAIAMVPPHLVNTWQDELRAVFHPKTVDVWTLESWDELFLLPKGKPARSIWFIISETMAKNGPYWEPAAVKDARGFLRCPDCGEPLRAKQGGEYSYLTLSDLAKSKKRCTAEVPTRNVTADGYPVMRVCGAALWANCGEHVWSPAKYIHKHMRGYFDYLVADESHQLKSDESARANALGALAASVKKVIAMTGTLIGGKASHVFPLLFRLSAQSLTSEDLTWSDSMEFAKRYGRVDTIITEKERDGFDNRRSNGKSRTQRPQEQPGIMPTLYGRHLIGNTIFLSLEDVAANLPSYVETLTPVTMSSDLSIPYRDTEEKLKSAVKQLLRKGSHKLLSPMLHALLAYPDYPYDWKPIGYVDASGGPNGRFVLVASPPTLDRSTLWPKERKLLEILKDERAQGRQAWVFCTYTKAHPVLERLETIVRAAGFRVKVLDADRVPTKGRSAWIARNAPGVDAIISHPQPVGTGLTLFDPLGSYNFPTLIFFETGYDLFALRQASRRSWRIGQTEPCRVHFLYYGETMQAKAMGLMAQKLDASLALEGEFSAEGLAALSAESGSMTMELAKSLVDNVDFGELERVWGRFGDDQATASARLTAARLEDELKRGQLSLI